MSQVKLSLVKDFDPEAQRITLYWVNESDEKASPDFTSMGDAHCWWIDFQNSLYSGRERRSSGLDRRWLIVQRIRQTNGIQRHADAPDGRRFTDQPISIARDMSRVRLLQHYTTHPELHENDVPIADPRQEALLRWGVSPDDS